MKRLTILAVAVSFSNLALAQSGAINAATMSPIRAMPAPANATRFGNILFPGGTPSSHPVRLGGTVSGSIPYTGVPAYGRGHGRQRTTVVPYTVPVFVGGYGYGGYGDPYAYAQQQPNVTVVMPQQPAPTVVINNHYNGVEGPRTTVATEEQPVTQSGLRVYEATPRESAPRQAEAAPEAPKQPARPAAYVRDDKPNIYQIALRDGSIREAIGYWIKTGELHFVTPKATLGKVALADIDRPASVRLNAERKLEFDPGSE